MMAKFKHPVVQWAHEHPVLFALFGTTIFFYLPARVIGKTIRTVKPETQLQEMYPALCQKQKEAVSQEVEN